MNLAAIPWARLHGASTHFPIVLTAVAFACDLLAVWRWDAKEARGLMQAAAGAIAFAAIGGIAAVVSGLFLSRGELWGSGDLGRHHRFVWPAFALLVGATVWRWCARRQLTRARLARYTLVVAVNFLLIAVAASLGGELLMTPP